MEDDYSPIPPSAYDAYINQIGASLQEASGADNAYREKALSAQMESAKEARANAMEIAQLQASTSRYGVDVASADRMKALKENARQFDATHGLEIAKAYTAFSSTPDMMFARNDFVNAMNRVGQGGGMPQPVITQSPGPQAKTWQDFSALASYNGSQVPGGGGGAAAQPSASGGGGSAQPAAAPGGGAGAQSSAQPPDPRLKAANAIVQAIPPSQSAGNDDNDWAAINAIRSLYAAALPGTFERLGAQRTKIAQAGMARAGFDPVLVHEEYLRSLPGQMSPLLSA